MAASLTAAATIAGYWKLFGLVAPPFGVPVMFYLIGAVGIIQLTRAVRMSEWGRRAAAGVAVVGFVVTVIGLGPGGACTGTGSCTVSLEPNPWLPVGLALTAAAIYVDLRRGPR